MSNGGCCRKTCTAVPSGLFRALAKVSTSRLSASTTNAITAPSRREGGAGVGAQRGWIIRSRTRRGRSVTVRLHPPDHLSHLSSHAMHHASPCATRPARLRVHVVRHSRQVQSRARGSRPATADNKTQRLQRAAVKWRLGSPPSKHPTSVVSPGRALPKEMNRNLFDDATADNNNCRRHLALKVRKTAPSFFRLAAEPGLTCIVIPKSQ